MSKTINNLNKSLAENITPDKIGAATSSDLDTVKNNIGTVSKLQTKDKTNLVGAINEIQNSYATAEYVDVNLKMTSGDLTKLQTTNKTNLVGAINELFQSANNGKQIIADAIGSPLSSDDTFAAMGNSINEMTTDFRNALALKGVNAPADKFETLINRIDEIVQSGNVLNNQVMVSGEYTLNV